MNVRNVWIAVLILSLGGASVMADASFQTYVKTEVPTGWLIFRNTARFQGQSVNMKQRGSGVTNKLEIRRQPSGTVSFYLCIRCRQSFLQTKGQGEAMYFFFADWEVGKYVWFTQKVGENVRLEQGPVDDEIRTLFQQKEGNPEDMNKISRKNGKVVEADSLWELVMILPEEMRGTLDRVFQEFSPKIQTETLRSEFTALLIRVAQEDRVVLRDQATVNRWIAELGSETFATRQAAERNLLQYAQTVSLSLEKLDKSSLDPEQQLRLRRISERVGKPDEAMMAEHCAASYVDQGRMWAKILESPNGEERKFALERLRELTKIEGDFDPFADEATRQKALEALRNRPEWKEKVQDE